MNRKLVYTAAAFGLALVVGLALALVIQISARALPNADQETAEYPLTASFDEVLVHPLLSPNATGDLYVVKIALAQSFGVVSGHPISYTVLYGWTGDGPAPNVQITDEFPTQVTITEIDPPPTGQSGNTLTWNLGTLDNIAFGAIYITGTVASGLPNGTVFTNTATIAGDVTDEDPENNVAFAPVEVQSPQPDPSILKWGLFEELDEGIFMTAEQGVETTFEILYYNWSGIPAPDTMVIDDLPSGVAYVSADPPPAGVIGQQLTWDLGTLPAIGYGEIIITVRPDQTGLLLNTATITNTAGDRDTTNNRAEFQFQVVPLLPPRLLKPNAQNVDDQRLLIVNENPTFEGLAKAGSVVTLYEGNADGCYGDFAGCNPVALISTTTGLNRRWVMTPTTMTDERTYSLYLRAELGGLVSSMPFAGWEPLPVRVDAAFAGWDLDNFVIETGGQENRPGGLGGTTGVTPNDAFTITIRQDLWPSVPTSPTLRAYHDLRLVIEEDGNEPYTITLPVTEFRPVPTDTLATAYNPAGALNPLFTLGYDKFYVQHGFGPGAHIHVWCRPVYYPDDPNDIPIVGLVWTLCNEILIDPAGYVYDVNTAGGAYEWPDVPPNAALVTNATVTATERLADDAWTRWEAEKTGQVNPQITDQSPADGIDVPGYYAFYVPSGQYKVLARAPDCAQYSSPILTVVDAPIFHNVGLRCSPEAQVGVQWGVFLPIVIRNE